MNTAYDVARREILWNVPPWLAVALYVASAASFAWIVSWFLRRSRLWRRGARDGTSAGFLDGLRRLAVYLATHRVIARDRYAGVMHRLVFWGFVVLLIATTLVAIEHHFWPNLLVGGRYRVFSLAADLGGVAFCSGAGMALWRRRRSRSSRLLPSGSTTLMLWALLAAGVSGFFVEAARIARDFPAFEIWSVVGYGGARVLAAAGVDAGAAMTLHRITWIAHAVLVIGVFILVPLTLLKHIVLAAWSVATSDTPLGVLKPPPRPVVGAIGLADFSALDLLQADACLTCGLCNEACPAYAAGKPLAPRSIVLGLRAALDEPNGTLAGHVDDAALWSCMACSACDAACPVSIRVLDKLLTLRRGRVAESAVPWTAAAALDSQVQKWNPFDQPNSGRLDWATGLDVRVAQPGETVELLYWVGCAGAFDPAGCAVSRAMATILQHLGVDYRVLGCRERCTGDPARRLGDEQLWQELAEHNRQTIESHGVATILTHCPHCYNSFKNEYPPLGAMPTVVHHTQWLSERLAELRLGAGDGSLPLLALGAGGETVTLHDPCYLARANDETEAPRRLLERLFPQGRREMRQHGRNTFCCGGGGGQMWLDVPAKTRVETLRARQVEETGAETVATACPFCRVMLEAGRAGLAETQGRWRVKDVAELIAERLTDA